MLYFNSIKHLIIFIFAIPILPLLFIMKYAFLITINFHKIINNNGSLIKTIILQLSLWLLAQCCLFLFPIQAIIINIHFFDLNALPLLTLISLLHLAIYFSFLSSKNKQIIKIISFMTFFVIVIAIILQFIFMMIKISLPIVNNLIWVVSTAIFYYMLMFLSWKIFNDNLCTIFVLIQKTWKILLTKSTIPITINEQLPPKSYSKIQLMLLTWQFEQLSLITNKKVVQNITIKNYY